MLPMRYWFVFVAWLLLIGPAGAAPDEPQRDVAKENVQLKTRIDALERQVKSLQQELEALKEELQPKAGTIWIKPTDPLPAKPRVWAVPPTQNEHPDWKEGQINGVR